DAPIVPCRRRAPRRHGGPRCWYRVRLHAARTRTVPAQPGPTRSRRGCRVANIKSQIKRIRQNEKRRLRNKSVKSALKTAIRKFHAALESGDRALATTLARDASRKLDKAVSKGVIHKNQAANKKSAIAKRLQSVGTSSSES